MDKILYNVMPPSDVSWLTKAPVTIVISTINHTYWSYVHQLSYLGGLTLYKWTTFSGFSSSIHDGFSSSPEKFIATRWASWRKTQQQWESVVDL